MNSTEAKARLETIYWVTNVALFSYGRYKEILKNQDVFMQMFPNTSFENPIMEGAGGTSSNGVNLCMFTIVRINLANNPQ